MRNSEKKIWNPSKSHFELHESPTFPAKTIRLGADSGTWPREAQKTERVAESPWLWLCWDGARNNNNI